MVNEKLHNILISLGYRIMKPYYYGKPVGYSIFIYDAKIHEVSQWFKGANGQQLIWNSENMEMDESGAPKYEEILETIKYFESSTQLKD